MKQRYSTAALGRAIREARERHWAQMSQQKLGEEAGYTRGPGAAVSISRVETGSSHPSPQRLAGIARALDLSAEQLLEAAIRLTDDATHNEAVDPKRASARGTSRPSDERNKGASDLKMRKGSGPARSTTDWARQIKAEGDRRSKAIGAAVDDYLEQARRAEEEFFQRFAEAASTVTGAPESVPDVVEDGSEDTGGAPTAEALAKAQIRVASDGIARGLAGGGGVLGDPLGSVAAQGLLSAITASGPAWSGSSSANLSGAAASSAALAFLGGRALAAGTGLAGGAAVLGTIVASPMLSLAVGGYLWMRRRNERQEIEQREQLRRAEKEFEDAWPSFDATLEIMASATDLLRDIATHAGRAQKKWAKSLPEGVVSWDGELTAAQQQTYLHLVMVAAAQLSIQSIDYADLLAARGAGLDYKGGLYRAMVTEAREVFEEAV